MLQNVRGTVHPHRGPPERALSSRSQETRQAEEPSVNSSVLEKVQKQKVVRQIGKHASICRPGLSTVQGRCPGFHGGPKIGQDEDTGG